MPWLTTWPRVPALESINCASQVEVSSGQDKIGNFHCWQQNDGKNINFELHVEVTLYLVWFENYEASFNYTLLCGLCCQKQVSQVRISNYIPRFIVGVITYPCLRYLLLAPNSSFVKTCVIKYHIGKVTYVISKPLGTNRYFCCHWGLWGEHN